MISFPIDLPELPDHLRMGWGPCEMMSCGWDDFYVTTEWIFTKSSKLIRRSLFQQWIQLCSRFLGDGILAKGVRGRSWYFQGMGDAYDCSRKTWLSASQEWVFPYPVAYEPFPGKLELSTEAYPFRDAARWFLYEKMPNDRARIPCPHCLKTPSSGIFTRSIFWDDGFYCSESCMRNHPYQAIKDDPGRQAWLKYYVPKNLMSPVCGPQYFDGFPDEGCHLRVERIFYYCDSCKVPMLTLSRGKCLHCGGVVQEVPAVSDPRYTKRIDGLTVTSLAMNRFLPKKAGGIQYG